MSFACAGALLSTSIQTLSAQTTRDESQKTNQPTDAAAAAEHARDESQPSRATTAPDPLDLDALLDIETDRPQGDNEDASDTADATASDDPAAARLERELTAQQAADKFQQAVEQMGEVAGRLRTPGDAGLTTQRIQQDILDKLELLIEWSEDQQSSGGSSSSSSGAQQQPQGGQNQPIPNDQRTQGQQQGAAEQPGGGGQAGEGTPPPFAERLGEAFDASSPEWGALPERVRQSLLEGAGDRYSAMYQRLTEEYYRRLAEEASSE